MNLAPYTLPVLIMLQSVYSVHQSILKLSKPQPRLVAIQYSTRLQTTRPQKKMDSINKASLGEFAPPRTPTTLTRPRSIKSLRTNASPSPETATATNVNTTQILSTTASMTTAKTPFRPEAILCMPHEEIVEVDAPKYRYEPYVTRIHRCSGFEYGMPYSNRHACKPVEQEDVEIFVLDRFHRETVTTLKNHTKCVFGCKLNESKCNFYERWNDYHCLCDCTVRGDTIPDCGRNREWGGSVKCDCVCRDEVKRECKEKHGHFDESTCSCWELGRQHGKPRECMKTGAVVVIMILVMVSLVLVVYLIRNVRSRYKRRQEPGYVEHTDEGVVPHEQNYKSDNIDPVAVSSVILSPEALDMPLWPESFKENIQIQ